MLNHDFSNLLKLIRSFQDIKPEEFTNRQNGLLITARLKRIKLLAKYPLCAEQSIRILNEILCLKNEFKIEKLSSQIEFNVELINTLVNSILLLLENEKNDEIKNILSVSLEKFQSNQSIFDLYTELKQLVIEHISNIDINAVMENVTEANRLNQTRGKNTIVVIGITGAGKSLTMHYIGGTHFSRNLFGNTLKMGAQPSYLKHITIGGALASETTHMGVVHLDDITTNSMHSFKGQDIILCDTPGAEDTREGLGIELKLSNPLQIILPLYKAKSVRFLVLISATTFDAKARDLLITLKFVAQIFVDEIALENACESLLFAISGDEGKNKYQEIKTIVVNELLKQQGTLNYDNKVKILIKYLKAQFEKNNVPLIRPATTNTVKPEDLITRLIQCKAITDPNKILTPFSEQSCVNQLKIHFNLLIASMNRILKVLSNTDPQFGLSEETEENLMQLLRHKFVELSFIDSFFEMHQSHTIIYFKELAKLLNSLTEFVTAVLCPKDQIEDGKIDAALMAVRHLCALDSLIRTLMYGVFENRELVVGLIHVFNESAKTPENYFNLDQRSWEQWVTDNQPTSAIKFLQEKIRAYQMSMVVKLNMLFKLQVLSVEQQQTQRLKKFNNWPEQKINFAMITQLQAKDEIISTYTKAVLQELVQHEDTSQVDGVAANFDQQIAELIEKGNFHSIHDLKQVIINLQIHEEKLSDFLDTQNSTSRISEPYATVVNSLTECFKKAEKINDFMMMMDVIERIKEISQNCGYAPHSEDLAQDFIGNFQVFVLAIKNFIGQREKNFSEEDTKSLIYKISLVQEVTKRTSFAFFVQPNYLSTLQLDLSAINNALNTCFTLLRQDIESICNLEYNFERFQKLQSLLEQLWFVLSIPFENQEDLIKGYGQVVQKIRDFCVTTSTQFNNNLLNKETTYDHYHDLKQYLLQVQNANWVRVLDLNQSLEILVTNNLNLRGLWLAGKAGKVDLSLPNAKFFETSSWIMEEIKQLLEIFKDFQLTCFEQLEIARDTYNKKLIQTLNEISSGNYFNLSSENLPFEIISQIHHYLNQCEIKGVFKDQVSSAKAALSNFIGEYAKVQKREVSKHIQNLSQNVNVDSHLTAVATRLQQFSQLRKEIIELYQLCQQPIEDWVTELNNLVLEYQDKLTQALQLATAGNVSDHEPLLEQCKKMHVHLDSYIKSENKQSKPLTFKRLVSRFENAFKTEHFPKLAAVMREVFAGHFKKAQELATEDKALALGTEMREILVQQIDTYISAMMGTIQRVNLQMSQNPSADLRSIEEFNKAYTNITSAQTLIEANLLSPQKLEKRDLLLNDTQKSLDKWLLDVMSKIDANLNQMQLKEAAQNYENLQETLRKLSIKPTNHDISFLNLKERINKTIKNAYEQFEKPIESWSKNTHTLAKVSRAFVEAKDMVFDGQSFTEKWNDISDLVYQKICVRCTELEEKFTHNEINMQQSILALTVIRDAVYGTAEDVTNLYSRIKKQLVQTINKISEDNIEARQGNARLENIQILLKANEQFVGHIGTLNLGKATEFVKGKALEIKNDIISEFNKGKLPELALIEFADLYQRLAKNFDFLELDKTLYVEVIENKLIKLFKTMGDALSEYKLGNEKLPTLITLNDALSRVTLFQKLGAEINGKVQLVDVELYKRVVAILSDFKQLIQSNSENFHDALANYTIEELNQTLNLAKSFQEISISIEKYVKSCKLSKLPEDLEELQRLNTDFSYIKLRDEVVNTLTHIKTKLAELNPKSSLSEGEAVRKEFYGQLKRDLHFMNSMMKLVSHLQTSIDTHVLEDDYGLHVSLDAIKEFLEGTYRLAASQMKNVEIPDVLTDWSSFNRYYQELTIFAEQCVGIECLDHLQLTYASLLGRESAGMINAFAVTSALVSQFDNYLKQVIDKHRQTYFTQDPPEGSDSALVALLAGLQKMAEDMPVLANNVTEVIKQFLLNVKKHRGDKYMTFLAHQLRIEEKGFGAALVAKQPAFAGTMIAERNKLTQDQGIDYVLNHLQIRDTKDCLSRKLYPYELQVLSIQYQLFDKKYSDMLQVYLEQERDFANYSNVYLGSLQRDLKNFIAANQINQDSLGNIIWDEKITNMIPELCAYLFVIWTLHESTAYFDSTNSDLNQHYLKKPHPAQLIAIFQMLNSIDAKKTGLINNIEEVLTGQGKSVVNSITAALLVSVGFAVEVGCYSDYLSGRDAEDAAWLFELLEIQDYVKYGTFNRLSEDMLNQYGDIRDLMRNALFGESRDIKPKTRHNRQTIAIIDEVDSLVTALFGHMYQPYFLLQGPKIDALLDVMWTKHKNKELSNLRNFKALPEYKACFEYYKDHAKLFEHAIHEMFLDLEKYKKEQGHEYYVTPEGELYYRHFDGATVYKSMGYRTYWACKFDSRISESCTAKHKGIKITCGAYSYVDLIRNPERYRAMLGVTGTLGELSRVEQEVVKKEFDIQHQTFVPSAHGKNKLQFNSGVAVKVVEDDEYDAELTNEIAKRLVGTNDTNAKRSVLVFFDTEEELESFYKSDKFNMFKTAAKKMTPKTITNTKERNAAISAATRSGQVTLAVKEHGRGSDFICHDPTVLVNGGMAVIDAYMPETAAEQRQHQGRTARLGQDGSYSMVLNKSDIINQFGLTDEQIKEAYNQGTLYKLIEEARNKKFEKGYQEIVDDLELMREKLHQPSMELLSTLQKNTNNRDEVQAFYQKTLPQADSVAAICVTELVKVLILFDSTGSMGDLIEALKATLSQVVQGLDEEFKESGLGKGIFQLQIAHYEDYHSGPDNALRYSIWSCDPEYLKLFINGVKADGGGANQSECVELGLFHASTLIEEGLTEVILIGDEPPSTKKEILKLREEHHKHSWPKSRFANAQHYKAETDKLATAKIPVSTFFVETSKYLRLKHKNGKYLTQHKFDNIAKMTQKDVNDSKSSRLDLSDPKSSVKTIQGLFARKVINAVVTDQTGGLADDIYQRFMKRMDQFRK